MELYQYVSDKYDICKPAIRRTMETGWGVGQNCTTVAASFPVALVGATPYSLSLKVPWVSK